YRSEKRVRQRQQVSLAGAMIVAGTQQCEGNGARSRACGAEYERRKLSAVAHGSAVACCQLRGTGEAALRSWEPVRFAAGLRKHLELSHIGAGWRGARDIDAEGVAAIAVARCQKIGAVHLRATLSTHVRSAANDYIDGCGRRLG